VKATQAERRRRLSHFGDDPWFLDFPKKMPADYLDYLDRTRKWRGKLALRHVAPLAFVPESEWPAIRKKVPEFAVVTAANRRAMHLYAALDHAYRQKAHSDGMPMLEEYFEYENPLHWLGRAILSDAGLKYRTWGNDSAFLLKTEAGVARRMEFRFGGQTLVFTIPKAEELLGEEGCSPEPPRES
jgi:hypothetical protein